MQRKIVGSLSAVAAFICLLVSNAALAQNSESLKGIRILWDRAQGFPSLAESGAFAGLGKELKAMGAFVTDLQPGSFYDETLLANYDIIIIANRDLNLLAKEQNALAAFINEGGSLLTFLSNTTSAYSVNPVIKRYGIMITGSVSNFSHLTGFNYPSTTKRRPVNSCLVSYPKKISVSGKAREIVGVGGSTPASMNYCIGALGFGGKGRVVALGEAEIWQSFG